MLGVSLFGLAPAVRSTARVSGKTLGAMKATQFRPHAVGVKTPRMLEVEARLGRTLEEDFQEYYVDKNWGQKRLSRRWQVTRAAIFGRGETTDLKCWVQVLQLPVRRAAPHAQAASPNASSACESAACRVCRWKAPTGSQRLRAAKARHQTSSSSARTATLNLTCRKTQLSLLPREPCCSLALPGGSLSRPKASVEIANYSS